VCDAESVTIQVNAENFDPADATYAWTYNGAPVGGDTSSIQGVGYGDYEVTVTVEGCPATSTVAIIQDTTPLAFSLGGPYVVCNPEFAIIQVTAENFDPATATYAWTYDGSPIGGNTSSLQAVGFGTYEVTVSIGDCTGTQSIAVTENTEAFDMALNHGCDGTVYMIHVAPAVDSEGIESYDPDTATVSWSGPNGFSSSDADADVTDAGIYTVTITTHEGCVSQGSIEVENTNCLLPRGISPNGDGMNDSFDLTGFNVAKLSIFNRYGREVYSKTNYTNEWIGQTDGGDELPTGTYFYSMERANGESKTGWVYINRQEN
jgi:gliding motility-associated-like protein